MISTLGRCIRLISMAICLVMVAWFVVFAVDQTKNASGHQQEQISEANTPAAQREADEQREHQRKSGVHEALDEVAEDVSSPFSSLVSGSSEWLENGERLGLALLIYGFGLGFLARTLRAV